MSVGLALLIATALLLMQAYLVAAEVAIASCNRTRLLELAEQKQRSAIAALAFLRAPHIALSTTLIGANLAGFALVCLAAVMCAQRDLSILFAPLIVLPFVLVIGHLVPKSIGAAYADSLVCSQAHLLRFLTWVFRPLVLLVSAYAKGVSRLFASDERDAFITRDELASLIESEPQSASPAISVDQREMIANVLELSEYNIRELMVPLSEVTALESDATIAQAAAELVDKQHSRMPIYHERVHNIVGVIHSFEILSALNEGGSGRLVSEIARPPSYVPQTMLASDLLVELQADGQHLAIVVDEYGGAIGIVTIEDLLEIVVGDIEDEYDREPSLVVMEKAGVWRIDGKASVERVNAELGLTLPVSEHYETVAGLLIDQVRRIPGIGEKLAVESAVLEVVEATDRAITVVRLTKKKGR